MTTQTKQYAIAYVNLFHNELKIAFIRAENEFEAIRIALPYLTNDPNIHNWYQVMLETNHSLESVKRAFLDTDQLIEVKEFV